MGIKIAVINNSAVKQSFEPFFIFDNHLHSNKLFILLSSVILLQDRFVHTLDPLISPKNRH